MEYRETGKKIAINRDELITHCLKEFDKDDNITKIIYNTAENKTIMVPEDVIKEAKLLWTKKQPKKEQSNAGTYKTLIIIVALLLIVYLFYQKK